MGGRELTRDDVADRVKKVICKHLGADIDAATDATLLRDLGADSLDDVEIAITLEAKFGIVIPDMDLEDLASVDDFVRAVWGRVQP
mgnify:CR=1 FL=1